MFTNLEFLNLHLNLTLNRNRNLKPTEASKIKIRITITRPSLLAVVLGELNRGPQKPVVFCASAVSCENN